MFTGARSGEITRLKWAYVQPPRLTLSPKRSPPSRVNDVSPRDALLLMFKLRSEDADDGACE